MALRFRRSLKIAPGIKINIGKRGGSLSFGRRGSTVTVGRGGTFANIGIPGTGLSWRTKIFGSAKSSRSRGVARRRGGGMTAAQQRAMNVVALQKEANLYNSGVDEGINQHKKTFSAQDVFEKKQAVKYICGEERVTLSVFFQVLFAPFFFMIALFGILMLFAVAKSPMELIVFAAISLFSAAGSVILIRKFVRCRKNEKLIQADYAKAFDGDQEAIGNIFESLLKNIDWFRETTPNFEVSSDGKAIYIDIDLPKIEDMPDCTMIVKKTEQAMYKHFKDEDTIAKDYSTHVHGIVMRIAGTCFAVFPSVEVVLCSGYTQRNNPQTGILQDDYVISAVFDRTRWSKTNPANSIPEKFIEQFPYRRTAGRKGILETITPLSPDDCKTKQYR